MIRDPHSADPNAQAPAGHPEAQVRIDQTNKLAGVQPAKYPAPPAPAPAPDVPAGAPEPSLGDVVAETTPTAPADVTATDTDPPA